MDFGKLVHDLTREAYPQLNIPEKPLTPPDPVEYSLRIAEHNLRESLKLFKDSPYWSDFVQMLRDELTEDELDIVVADTIGHNNPSDLGKTGAIMISARNRTYKICAERFIKELCSNGKI